MVWNLKYCFVSSLLYPLSHWVSSGSHTLSLNFGSVLNGLPDSTSPNLLPICCQWHLPKKTTEHITLVKFSKVSPSLPGWSLTPLSGPKVLHHLLFYLLAGLANQHTILTIHCTAAHLSASSCCPLHLECFPNQINLTISCLYFKTQTRQHLPYDNFPDSPHQW